MSELSLFPCESMCKKLWAGVEASLSSSDSLCHLPLLRMFASSQAKYQPVKGVLVRE